MHKDKEKGLRGMEERWIKKCGKKKRKEMTIKTRRNIN